MLKTLALLPLALVSLAAAAQIPLTPPDAGAGPQTTPATVPPPRSLADLEPRTTTGLLQGATLPADCGGAILPGNLVERQRDIDNCLADLAARLAALKAAEELRKARDAHLPVLPAAPALAVSDLNARGPRSELLVRDTPTGVATDDGKRTAVLMAPTAPTGPVAEAMPELASLADLSLIGGGCGDVCVAIFKAGGATISVQRRGDPIATNAYVTAISAPAGRLTVTVTLNPEGAGKPASKEFRL